VRNSAARNSRAQLLRHRVHTAAAAAGFNIHRAADLYLHTWRTINNAARTKKSAAGASATFIISVQLARSVAECGVRPAFALSKADPAQLHKGAGEKWHPLLSSHHTYTYTLAVLSPYDVCVCVRTMQLTIAFALRLSCAPNCSVNAQHERNHDQKETK
jgi:hypothetical protein